MNELWEKMGLMMPGYLSSLTHSVSIRLLALPPHHPSLTHSLSLCPLATSLFLILRLSFSLSGSFLSPSPQTVTLCLIGSRCWQLRGIESNMWKVWERGKEKKTSAIVQQILFVWCGWRTVGASPRVQSRPGYFRWLGYGYISFATSYLSAPCLFSTVPFAVFPQSALRIDKVLC